MRLRALMVTDLEGSPALLERLNAFNAGLGSMHLFFHRGAVRAVSDVPAWPFVPEHIEHALEEFCQICDGLMLQAEFGGDPAIACEGARRLKCCSLLIPPRAKRFHAALKRRANTVTTLVRGLACRQVPVQ